MNLKERKFVCKISSLLTTVPFVNNMCDIGGLAQYANEMHRVRSYVSSALYCLVTDDYEYATDIVEELENYIESRKQFWK